MLVWPTIAVKGKTNFLYRTGIFLVAPG
jgi:hypothetical protein